MYPASAGDDVGITGHGGGGHVHIDELVASGEVFPSAGYLHHAAYAGRDEFLHPVKGEVPVCRYPLLDGEGHVGVRQAHYYSRLLPVRQETAEFFPFPAQHFQKLFMRAGLHTLATFRKAIV